ncbi:MAG: CorA family divalent cation transporter [Nanoarchaeota archaeon]
MVEIKKINIIKNKEKIRELKKDYSLLYEFLSDETERPKLIVNNNYILVVLRTIEYSIKFNFKIKAFFILYDKNKKELITNYIFSNEELEELKKEKVLTIDKIIKFVLDSLIEHFENLLDKLEAEFERISLLNEDLSFKDVFSLFRVLNLTDALLQIIKSDIDVLSKLNKNVDSVHLKIRIEHLNQLFDELQFLDSKTSNLIQTYSIYYNLKSSRILDKISIIAFLFLIPSTIFAMYGMNFKYIPLYDYYYGFILVSFLSFFIVIVLYYILKRKIDF